MPAAAASPWTPAAGHLRIRVRLTPRSSSDRVDGIGRLSDGSAVLQARVRAVPEAGAANAALIAVLARLLDLPRSRLTLASGSTARIKEVRAEGDPAILAERLAGVLAGTAKAR